MSIVKTFFSTIPRSGHVLIFIHSGLDFTDRKEARISLLVLIPIEWPLWDLAKFWTHGDVLWWQKYVAISQSLFLIVSLLCQSCTPVCLQVFFCQQYLFHHRGSFCRKLDDLTHASHYWGVSACGLFSHNQSDLQNNKQWWCNFLWREEWVQVGGQSHCPQGSGFLRASWALNIHARIPQVV